MRRNKIIRDKIIAITLAVLCGVAVAFAVTHSASFSRDIKSLSSDFGGGLNRTITVYDYNGGVIKSWAGKFDVSESADEVYFDDEDGKRVIIHGGIVINEEE